MQYLTWFGIVLVVLGLSLIFLMVMKSRTLKSIKESERNAYIQKLVALNFAGVGISVLGLMIVFITKFIS